MQQLKLPIMLKPHMLLFLRKLKNPASALTVNEHQN